MWGTSGWCEVSVWWEMFPAYVGFVSWKGVRMRVGEFRFHSMKNFIRQKSWCSPRLVICEKTSEGKVRWIIGVLWIFFSKL